MKSKVLLHTAVLLDVIAALIIFENRAVDDYLSHGIISAQNLPLAVVVMMVIFLAEVSSLKRISNFQLLLFLLCAALLLFCSFYLPPVSESATGEPSVLAYGALMAELSIVIMAAFSKSPTFGKTLALFIFSSAVCGLVGFAYTFSNEETFHENSKADAAVVLGASVWGKHKPSPILRGRLDEALDIFKSGRVKKVVVTGGTRRFGTVESEVQAWYLEEQGIPDSDVIAEENTFCTSEQAIYVKEVLMDSLGMKKLVLVSDDWHLPRALLMCRWEGAEVMGMASGYKMLLPKELYFRARESAAILAFLLFGS
ncbi:MAG: YdcF family protein [Candidatus Kryptoniota bacterium]